jgi:hypothetical protein
MTRSTNAPNGRGQDGRFAKGNSGGPGNPHARRVARLRSALLNAVKPDDVREVVVTLLASAKAGEVAAIRELFQRLLGPPVELDMIERLETLEQRLDEFLEMKEARS